MLTQRNNGSGKPSGLRKLHSIHVLPNGRDFDGRIEFGGAKYKFAFAPREAIMRSHKLTLTGDVTIFSQGGKKRTVEKVEATLLATQGSAVLAPSFPRSFNASLKLTATDQPPSSTITDATGPISSVGVLYFRLSELNGQSLGIPMDMVSVQLNVRLYPTSELERDLQWVYSALVITTLGNSRNDEQASAYLAELNRILKASSS